MSSNVLVVLETKGAGWHRMSFEALAAGQKLADELGVSCSAVVMGEAGAIAPLADRMIQSLPELDESRTAFSMSTQARPAASTAAMTPA